MPTIPELKSRFEALLSKLTAPGMDADELRSRYKAVIASVREIERTEGAKILEARLRTAFKERVRHIARRIVETEIHREFSLRMIEEYADDKSIRHLRWTLSPDHPEPDICDYLAGVDRYGLGGGVYTKLRAPVPPAHPYCRCMLLPFDAKGKRAHWHPKADERYFVREFTLDPREAARIAGSRDKLARILGGESPIDILNAGRPDEYRLVTLAEAIKP